MPDWLRYNLLSLKHSALFYIILQLFLKPSLGIQSVIMCIIFYTACKHKHQYEINMK